MLRLSSASPSKIPFSTPKFHIHQPHSKLSFLSPTKQLPVRTIPHTHIPTQPSLIESTPNLTTQQKQSSYKRMKQKVKEKIKKILSEKKFESYPFEPFDTPTTQSLKNTSMNFLRNSYLNYMNKNITYAKPKEPSLVLQNNFSDFGGSRRMERSIKRLNVFDSPLLQSRVKTASNQRYSHKDGSNMKTIESNELLKNNKYSEYSEYLQPSELRKSQTIHSERREQLKVSLEIETKLLRVSKHAKEMKKFKNGLIKPKKKKVQKVQKEKEKDSQKEKVKIKQRKKEIFLGELEPWNNPIQDF